MKKYSHLISSLDQGRVGEGCFFWVWFPLLPAPFHCRVLLKEVGSWLPLCCHSVPCSETGKFYIDTTEGLSHSQAFWSGPQVNHYILDLCTFYMWFMSSLWPTWWSCRYSGGVLYVSSSCVISKGHYSPHLTYFPLNREKPILFPEAKTPVALWHKCQDHWLPSHCFMHYISLL